MLAVSSLKVADPESGVRIWSVPEGRLIRRVADTQNAIGAVSWRPDSTALAAMSLRPDGTPALCEWDPSTGNLIHWVGSAEVGAVSIAYSGADRIAVGYSDGRFELWDPAGTLVASRDDHARTAVPQEDGLQPVQVAASASMVASSSIVDNTIRLWDARTGALVLAFPDTTHHTSDPAAGPSSLAFSADGNILYTNSDLTTITLWETVSGSMIGSLDRGTRPGTTTGSTLLGIAVSRDGRTKVAATGDGTVLRWHANPNWLNEPTGSVGALDFSADGRAVVAGDSEGGVSVWTTADGTRTVATHVDDSVFGAKYTRDGTRITGTLGATFTVTATSGGVSRPRSVHVPGRVFRGAITVSPDGTMFAASHENPVSVKRPKDNRVSVWDVATLRPRAELELGDQWPVELAFAPDGTRLTAITGTEGAAVVDGSGPTATNMLTWRVPEFGEAEPVPVDDSSLVGFAYTPDGRSIVTGGITGELLVRDAATGKVRRKIGDHSATVRKVALSPDGGTAATVTVEDSVVRLWDVRDGTLLAVLSGHGAPLNEVIFSPDGTRLATGGTDTDVGLWYLEPAVAIRQICANLADAGEEGLSSLGC
jgi:WD40 repeat protein